MLSPYFKITSLLDVILLPVWLRFRLPKSTKSGSWRRHGASGGRLGDVLERFGGVLERLGRFLGHLGASWSRLGAVLEYLGPSLTRLGAPGKGQAAPTGQQLAGPSRPGGGRGRVTLPLDWRIGGLERRIGGMEARSDVYTP